MQPKFSFSALLGGTALFAAVLAADSVLDTLPDRQAAPRAVASLNLEPIELAAGELAPLALVGAWQVTSPERRVGGISGLAVDGEELIAITDAGVVLRFSKQLGPRMPALVADLPAGPGDERLKVNRDSEAILRDPGGRGWWVAFENREELWLFDPGFRRALAREIVPRAGMSENVGIEGLAGDGGGILAFLESGRSALRWSGGWGEVRLDPRTPLSDAAQLADGRILLLERRLTLTGFRNSIALVRPKGGRFQRTWRKRLPVSWRDNLEAIAAEPRAGGGYRLWIMSDDNFHPRLRTVLLVLDVPEATLPKRP